MTTKTVKLIAFITLLVHGIGHFQGVVSALGVRINNTAPATSWLLKGLGEKTRKTICLVLFLATGIIGILTALSFNNLLLAYSLWQPLVVVTALLSTGCLVVFPQSFAMFFNKAGAIGVNILIYYSIVLGQHWPAVLFED